MVQNYIPLFFNLCCTFPLMSSMDLQTFKTIIGNKVKKLRQEKGYSVRKFALLADMEHHQILALEKGDTDFRLSTLIKLSNAFGVSPHELVKD